MIKDNVSNGETLPSDCLSRTKVSEEFILHSALNEHQQLKLAISVSSNEILLYDAESQAKTLSFKGHENTITGLKFSQESPDLLFSSSQDGKILLWDQRKGIHPVKSYCDNSDPFLKPLICFDYNASEQYLCAGTEVIREDSFLIFWDKRLSEPVGGYWDSHYDEITQVKFHPSNDAQLASSSVDGIINIFNLLEQSEEDALENTLNVGSSINRFCWGLSDTVSCITSTEEYQFWSLSEVKSYVSMITKQLSEEFLCDVDYLIDTFAVNNSTILATGTKDGCFQLYSCNAKGLKIIREFRNGHTDVVRTISHSKCKNIFLTGGEDGILCIWKSPS